jgi:alcohol dehydrogenase class IV
LTPAAAVLDAEIAATTPLRVLGPSGMNAVHHCLEAFYSKGARFVTDAFALSALRQLLVALPLLMKAGAKPDIAALQMALNATALSGLTYGNSWLGIGHSVCHSLGGR